MPIHGQGTSYSPAHEISKIRFVTFHIHASFCEYFVSSGVKCNHSVTLHLCVAILQQPAQRETGSERPP